MRERSNRNVPNDEFLDLLEAWKPFSRFVENKSKESLFNSVFPYNFKIARALLKDKHIVFIGDSLVRAMYKDMILMLQSGDLCKSQELKVSNEDEFHGDKHIDFLELDANRVFRQAREWQTNRHLLQYFFTNRAMREDLEKTCLMIEASDERPGVVIMNSAIWDVSRFPSRISGSFPNEHLDDLYEEINVGEDYFNRIAMFCRRMRVLLPPSSTFVWLLMPPTATPEVSGKGFCSYNRLNHSEIRTRLLEANVRAAQIVREAGFDVLDLSFHMRLPSYQPFRVKDGVHWNTVATRFMTQLLLGHLAAAWRMDRSVMRKWNSNINLRTSRDFRSPCFATAMQFLKDRNQRKHENESVNQIVRSASLSAFDLGLSRTNPRIMSLSDLMATMRALLFFYKFDERTSGSSNLHLKAFGRLPQELSRFSQSDIMWISRAIETVCKSWKGRIEGNMLSYTELNKRKHEPSRRILLPTPPVPPGLQSTSFTMTIPNRIAEAEPYRQPPSKKKRPNN